MDHDRRLWLKKATQHWQFGQGGPPSEISSKVKLCNLVTANPPLGHAGEKTQLKMGCQRTIRLLSNGRWRTDVKECGFLTLVSVCHESGLNSPVCVNLCCLSPSARSLQPFVIGSF